MSPSGSPGYPTPLDGAVPGFPGATSATQVVDMKATVGNGLAPGGVAAPRQAHGWSSGCGVVASMAPKAGQARSGVLLLVGVVGIVGGLGLLAYGLAPAKDL